MTKHKPLKGPSRERLIEELYRKYGKSVSTKNQLTYMRKKYSWLFVVEGAKLLKRFLDIIGSIMLIIVFGPLMILIALIILIIEGPPVFYITHRVGKWGNEFLFPKFRTMKVGAEELKESLMAQNVDQKGKHFKIKDDPRITKLGRFLRRTSLDELPQLWNVLKGDMSLVGPRPPLPKEVASYTLEERRRLEIVPGLTGLWQVSGRTEIPFHHQVKLDIQYIESQSFWLDLKLLLKTIPAVILGKGAY